MEIKYLGEFLPNVFGYKVTEEGKVLDFHNREVLVHGSGNVKIKKWTGGIINIRINQLVARAFVPNPNNYRFVKPLDGNPENVHASNLSWVKEAKDVRKSPEVAEVSVKTQDVPSKKKQVEKLIKQGYRGSTIARMLEVSPQYVNRVKKTLPGYAHKPI